MDKQAFEFNSDVVYQSGGTHSPAGLDLVHSDILVSTTGGGFKARFPDVFEKYVLPYVESDKVVQAWLSHPMQFWQNQINFAVWCATTGCGVSKKDHLAAPAFEKALFSFHVYYQVRRILEEIGAPLPQDDAWEAFNNPYSVRGYEGICREFGVSPNTSWHVEAPNHGLGVVYTYARNYGYFPLNGGLHYERYRKNMTSEAGIYDKAGYPGKYDPKRMSFTEKTTNKSIHIDYIADVPRRHPAWTTFILDKSKGFTQPGVERLNDSIRTYVWAILGAQAQTRTSILGTGTAFDAQKQFMANVEDAISSPVDLPSAIRRYQDVLQYAGSEVNFVFGIGLYMAPGSMLLRGDRVAGYNNEIVVATSSQSLGLNTDVNVALAPPNSANNTGEAGLVEPIDIIRKTASTEKWGGSVDAKMHDEEKKALVVGSILVGLFVLWLLD